MSPISSRKRVPEDASSSMPSLRESAPVKAPLSWPKSSLSIRDSGRPPKLMGTKGPSGLEEIEWM